MNKLIKILLITAFLLVPLTPVFPVSAGTTNNLLPLYRFWSSKFKSHFFTPKVSERDKLINTDPNWSYENVAYRVRNKANCEAGDSFVYRFWSPIFRSHFYTISITERDKIITTDFNWIYEGESFCASKTNQAGMIPVFRFWSPAFTSHFYTTSTSERDKLINTDPNWQYENIAYYAWAKEPEAPTPPPPSLGTVLMFVSQQNTYYSEYKITLEALKAAGYSVDVRSATTNNASIYSTTGNINDAGNQVGGATYTNFTTQFQQSFGQAWNASWNATPASIPVNGSILTVPNMNSYVALVIPGGTGAKDYRFDGSYVAQGSADATTVQAVAGKLNSLAIDALSNGKPVMALCHGASLPVFFRVPGTAGSGFDGQGLSILQGRPATGFPEPDTATVLNNYGATFRADDKVTITTPNGSFHNGYGDYKLITSRDWYAQTVSYAARSLLNILDSYPTKAQAEQNIDVLILHGGAVNVADCGPGNTATNDVPCNYGTGANTPADYTDLVALLNANSTSDNYNFTVSQINLLNSTPNLTTLNNYDVVIYFKHWSTGMTDTLQQNLKTYADNGGGLLGLHHGLYNQPAGAGNKNILVNEVFGAQSVLAGFVLPALHNYTLYNTNYGHFVSTFGIGLTGNPVLNTPGGWLPGNLPPTGSSLSFSNYQNFAIYDELYYNLVFQPGQSFGRGTNQVTPILSNAYGAAPASQYHTSGFVKKFNPSLDASIGRVGYFQPGERKESINVNHRYGQLVRNAVVWLAQ